MECSLQQKDVQRGVLVGEPDEVEVNSIVSRDIALPLVCGVDTGVRSARSECVQHLSSRLPSVALV